MDELPDPVETSVPRREPSKPARGRATPAPRQEAERTPSLLDQIRGNTSYGLLRALINLGTALSTLATLILTVVALKVGYNDPLLIPLSLALSVAVILAGRQASLVLVDIADTLLWQAQRSAGSNSYEEPLRTSMKP